MLTLTDTNFSKEVINNKEFTLVEFWAPWCGPCQMMAPIIEKIAHDFENKGLKVGKLNVDEEENTPRKYNIMSIPTIIIFKDGKPFEQMIGVQREEALKKKLDALLLG